AADRTTRARQESVFDSISLPALGRMGLATVEASSAVRVVKRICVFAGSSAGARAQYSLAARELGSALARRQIGLVYGGARVGLMGALADAALAAGGHVTGVIPESLVAKEIAHQGLSDLRIVSSMHQRKALMNDLADGFAALPGGLGTFEEFF